MPQGRHDLLSQGHGRPKQGSGPHRTVSLAWKKDSETKTPRARETGHEVKMPEKEVGQRGRSLNLTSFSCICLLLSR